MRVYIFNFIVGAFCLVGLAVQYREGNMAWVAVQAILATVNFGWGLHLMDKYQTTEEASG